MSEGDMHFQKVSGEDFRSWIIENPELVEHNEIRYEYNFLSERLIIKYMATPTHETLQDSFRDTVFGSLVEKVGRTKPRQLVTSEPKRPVRPSLAMGGTDCGLGWVPGTDGSCGVRPDGCPGRTVGTAGVFDGAIH